MKFSKEYEKLVEVLKSLKEVITIKEWDEYVEERKKCIGMEEKKETFDRKWSNKFKKQFTESSQPRTKVPSEHQDTSGHYGTGPPPMYPCYMPTSTSQGYSYQYYYGGYPRPPYQ